MAVAILLAGCTTTARQQSTPPTGVQWALVELDGAPAVGSGGSGGAYMQLEADSARVTGFTTCNRFFGRYEVQSGGRLRFSQLGSTKMACVEPARSQQETRFMTVLQAADRYELVGDTLALYAAEQRRARFVAAR
jgi:heat shock protein HslJ